MTPLDPPMSVCYECSRSTDGRCWRHRNVDLANYRPKPAGASSKRVADLPCRIVGDLSQDDGTVEKAFLSILSRRHPDIRWTILDEDEPATKTRG